MSYAIKFLFIIVLLGTGKYVVADVHTDTALERQDSVETGVQLALAEPVNSTEKDIPKKNAAKALVNNVTTRYEGKTEVSVMSLVTCAYKIKNKKMGCASQPRKKRVKSITKNYGENLHDSRGLLLVVEPISEYGIGILQYDYFDRNKDADQWLYLPELDKVKRVASSSDAPKKGSLFGSEFALEDVEKLKIEDYQYEKVEDTVLKGRPVMVVDITPNEKRAKKTNYLKRRQWIDTERLVVLKEEFYSWNGKVTKTQYASKVTEEAGIWAARKLVMQNRDSERISVMSISSLAYNQAIDDEALTTRILEDVVFRESYLKTLELSKHN